MLNRPQTPEVAAIGKINFSGNLIPESWYHEIKTEKRVSLSAVVILSEIVWWYRPREIRDEQSGKVIEYARKFKGETLQRSYASLANKFGLSKKQAADACKLLESLGLITLEVKKCVVLPSGDRLGNVMYIHINPERIAQITHPLSPQSNSPSLGGSYVSKSNSSDQNNEGLSPESNRVAPESNRVAPERNRLLPESETYTEITTETTSEISSEIKNQDPLYPPEGDGGFANACQEEEGEQEAQLTDPKLPEQNTTLANNSNPVKGQGSAPRRRSPSKATQKIQRAYSGELPQWRYGYGLNEYHDWFVRYARQKHQELPEDSYYKKSFSPVGLIALRESKAEFEELQQRCDEAWAIEAKRQAAEAALAAQTIAEAQPEEPREMPMDAIARIMQAQGLTPADVLPEVKSEYRAVFNRLPSDPQEAWDLLSRAQLSIVATFLDKKYATP